MLAAAPAAALDETEGTALLDACTHDIGRFRGEVTPGRDRLASRLGAREARLGPSCRNALTASGL